MWVVGAHSARRGQALVIGLVALPASAAVAAAPWYAVAAGQRVGVAVLSATPVPERLISVRLQVDTDQPAPADLRDELRRQFAPAGFTPVFGGSVLVELHRCPGRVTSYQHLAAPGQWPADASPPHDLRAWQRGAGRHGDRATDHRRVCGASAAAALPIVRELRDSVKGLLSAGPGRDW